MFHCYSISFRPEEFPNKSDDFRLTSGNRQIGHLSFDVVDPMQRVMGDKLSRIYFPSKTAMFPVSTLPKPVKTKILIY